MPSDDRSSSMVVRFLRGWQALADEAESVLVSNIAATVPWLAPVIPAWMAYSNLTTDLGMPGAIGFVGAIVIEGLGITTISTALELWRYNDRRAKSEESAPLALALVTSGAYLVVVLATNVVPEWGGGGAWQTVLVRGLLTLMSVPAAVVLGLRAQHHRRVADRDRERRERRDERRERQAARYGEMPQVAASRRESPRVATSRRESPKTPDWRALGVEDRERIAAMSSSEVMAEWPVSARTAREWREKARNNGWHQALQEDRHG